jgi:uncharacterized protein YqkB
MDYFEDDIIEEEISSSVNFIELKNDLKLLLDKLKIVVKDNDKKKINNVCKDIDKLLKEYW